MNYIWDLVVKAEKLGLSRKDIYFKLAYTFSPYMELCLENLNSTTIDQTVEVNPYYRYDAIFKELFSLDNNQDMESRQVLFDLVLHFLAEIDLLQGMNKKEYYIQFVLKDIAEGLYGESAKEKIKLFTTHEKELIAINILRLYETGEAIYLLKNTMRKLFKDCIIYAKCEEKDELLIYIGKKRCNLIESKIELILQIFLPIRFQATLYWDNHFGLIDIDKTMKIDKIALY